MARFKNRVLNFVLVSVMTLSQGLGAAAEETKKGHQGVPEIPDLVLGSEDASVTLVEYLSINCPHCAAFHLGAFKDLKKKYVDTGKVRYVLRHFPLDYRAVEFMALIATQPQEHWLDLIEKSYEHIVDWIFEGPDKLAEILKVSKADRLRAKKDQEMIDKIMAKRYNAELNYNIDATPAYLIEGPNQKPEFINTVITAKELEKKLLAFLP